MADEERYDPLLLSIAQRCTGGVDELLDIFLGFLRRKTDAFDPPGGWPQLEAAFTGSLRRQFEAAQRKKAARVAAASGAAPAPAAKKVSATADSKATAASSKPATSVAASPTMAAPAAAARAAPQAAPDASASTAGDAGPVFEMSADGSFDLSKPSAPAPSSTAAPAAVAPAAVQTSGSATAAVLASAVPEKTAPAAAAASAPAGALGAAGGAAAPAGSKSAEAAAGASASADAADSEKPKGPRPVGNGGVTDRYAWTQTLQDVSVSFRLPAGVARKDVAVEIKKGSLKVSVRGGVLPPAGSAASASAGSASSSSGSSCGSGGMQVVFDAPLHKRAKLDDSTWTIDAAQSSGTLGGAGGGASSSGSGSGCGSSSAGSSKVLTVFLAKEYGMEWWPAVGEGEPAIDVSQVEPENSKLGDLDADTRSTVEKMMFDQRQKAMGLPSSDELKKQEVLRKFMAAHPEMDFSKAKIS